MNFKVESISFIFNVGETFGNKSHSIGIKSLENGGGK